MLLDREDFQQCHNCGSPLSDEDFARCGITLNARPRGIYFEFDCPSCGQKGRFTIPNTDTPDNAVRQLLSMLERTSTAQRGIESSDLTKIHGVDDFLKRCMNADESDSKP